MTKPTKSAQIIHLLESTDLTREQIAAKVGCMPAYVRVVEQRLAGNDPAKRWKKRNPDYEKQRQSTDEYRAMKSAYARRRYADDPEYRDRVKVMVRRYQARLKKERQSENA